MKTAATRSVLALLLVLQCVASTGCSSLTTGRLPNDPSSDLPEVKTGRDARVYLITGAVHEGEVMQVSGTQITLGKPSNHGFQETVILAEEIDWIEFEHASQTESRIGGTVAIVSAVLILALFGLLLAFSGTDWGGS